MNERHTLWRDPAKKFKPVNKQAALICRAAHGFECPPPEEPAPRFAVPLLEQLAAESKARRSKIAMMEAENAARTAALNAVGKKTHEQQFRRKMNRYEIHQQGKVKRLVDKIAAKLAHRIT